MIHTIKMYSDLSNGFDEYTIAFANRDAFVADLNIAENTENLSLILNEDGWVEISLLLEIERKSKDGTGLNLATYQTLFEDALLNSNCSMIYKFQQISGTDVGANNIVQTNITDVDCKFSVWMT